MPRYEALDYSETSGKVSMSRIYTFLEALDCTQKHPVRVEEDGDQEGE
jgi:hypothetical protein